MGDVLQLEQEIEKERVAAEQAALAAAASPAPVLEVPSSDGPAPPTKSKAAPSEEESKDAKMEAPGEDAETQEVAKAVPDIDSKDVEGDVKMDAA